MLVADVMTKNVVTLPSDTTLAAARRMVDAFGFRRIPILDRGKLVGIVTRNMLDRTGPSQLTTFSLNEISDLLNKVTVRDVMRTDVVTVTPDMTVEEAVALAQRKKVGSLVVLERDKVVGIVTTNDIFYKVLNPILGIGMPGSRIVIRGCHEGPDIARVLAVINRLGIPIITLLTIEFPETQKHDLVIHLDTEDTSRAIQEILKLGCTVEARAR